MVAADDQVEAVLVRVAQQRLCGRVAFDDLVLDLDACALRAVFDFPEGFLQVAAGGVG